MGGAGDRENTCKGTRTHAEGHDAMTSGVRHPSRRPHFRRFAVSSDRLAHLSVPSCSQPVCPLRSIATPGQRMPHSRWCLDVRRCAYVDPL